jgi:hypothetical protein
MNRDLLPRRSEGMRPDKGTYSYFDHDADIGIIGCGGTLEQAFESAAHAMFSIMSDIARLRSDITAQVDFEEADVELALVTWLNLPQCKLPTFLNIHFYRKGHRAFPETDVQCRVEEHCVAIWPGVPSKAGLSSLNTCSL